MIVQVRAAIVADRKAFTGVAGHTFQKPGAARMILDPAPEQRVLEADRLVEGDPGIPLEERLSSGFAIDLENRLAVALDLAPRGEAHVDSDYVAILAVDGHFIIMIRVMARSFRATVVGYCGHCALLFAAQCGIFTLRH